MHIVFENLSLTAPEGRILCVTGESGCGKTTLLRMLMGLEQPDAGTITGLEGRRISAVFQEDRLCENLSAAANVRLVLSGRRRADIEDIFSSLGLSGALDQPARTLSGGMRRRVALARALLAEYDLLLLDEPFNGLDVETRRRAIACLRARLLGRTAVIVTHDPDLADLLGGVSCHLPDLIAVR